MPSNLDLNYDLQSDLLLLCGVTLKNRLAKSPMSDLLADGEGNPTEAQIRRYEGWAEGGVALSFVGAVQCDFRYPEKPGNLVFNSDSHQAMLKSFTDHAVIGGVHLWPQIGPATRCGLPLWERIGKTNSIWILQLLCGSMSSVMR